jgi:antitoxin component YwqK of YwqJK toxin-antitoxin module
MDLKDDDFKKENAEGHYYDFNKVGGWIDRRKRQLPIAKIKYEKTEMDENGLYRKYWSNGQVRYEWYFENESGARKDGISKGWWPNGQLKQSAEWKDDKKNGLNIFYYENGNKSKEVFFKDSESVWRKKWDEDGRLIHDGT